MDDASSLEDIATVSTTIRLQLRSVITWRGKHMFLRNGQDAQVRPLLAHVRRTSLVGHRWTSKESRQE